MPNLGVPELIVIFLIIVASARFLSLMTWREDIERNAKALLQLASAELSLALTARNIAPGSDPASTSAAARSSRRRARRAASFAGSGGAFWGWGSRRSQSSTV